MWRAGSPAEVSELTVETPVEPVTHVTEAGVEFVVQRRQSLSCRGRALVLGGVATYAITVGAVMYVLTGWIIPSVFLLAAASSLIAAFGRVGQAEPFERICISANTVRVERRKAGRWSIVWDAPVAFTQVNLVDTDRHRQSLLLSRCGRRVRIGDLLGQDERVQLGITVNEALSAACRARGGLLSIG
jgi:uncharacterized membrane protein